MFPNRAIWGRTFLYPQMALIPLPLKKIFEIREAMKSEKADDSSTNSSTHKRYH